MPHRRSLSPTRPLSLLPPSSADGVAAYATKGIWISALYQALTVLAFEGLGVAADAGLHCLDDEAHWPRARRAPAPRHELPRLPERWSAAAQEQQGAVLARLRGGFLRRAVVSTCILARLRGGFLCR